jgi:ferredoxin/flavodoxin---NADP+ reductase
MTDQPESNNTARHAVIVVGAGPAGIFLSERLAQNNVDVLLINRDVRPGGLVEYGIYPNKYKLKGGIRRGIKKALALPEIDYLGNVSVGDGEKVTLEQLRGLGASAVAVTVGAQGTNYLGLCGEKRTGVYHAKDLVYHYTDLPPYADQEFPLGARVLIVGMGNVAIDIAHWLVRVKKVEEVTIIARRGPAERKYVGKEVKVISANLDREDFDAEIERVRRAMEAVGQDVDAVKAEMLKHFDKKPVEKSSETRLRFRFLVSPIDFMGEGEDGALKQVKIAHNELYKRDDGSTGCRTTGEESLWDMDSAAFAVGDRADDNFGLPYKNGKYVTGGGDGIEAYEIRKEDGDLMEGLFVAGWSRNASDGLVGVAKQDGQKCAEHLLSTLKGKTAPASARDSVKKGLLSLLEGRRLSNLDDVAALEGAEAKIREAQGLDEYKFSSNKAMFEAIDKAQSE